MSFINQQTGTAKHRGMSMRRDALTSQYQYELCWNDIVQKKAVVDEGGEEMATTSNES